MNAKGTLTNGLIGTAVCFAVSLPVAAFAGLEVSFQPDGMECNTLLAGQYIEAGEVCVEVQGDFLSVTYKTMNGWELKEAQLWTGLNMAEMPATKNGNPKIGNFPYNAGDITGATSYSFSVPLEEVFGTPDQLCDVGAYLAAHATVRHDNGDGTYQTETGWVEGEQIREKGSWAMYSSLLFTCPPEEEMVAMPECGNETAYALGDRTFKEILDSPRWGWELEVNDEASLDVPIYAGAGQNDISKGTLVGHLLVARDGELVTVRYEMLDGFTMSESHLYVDDKEISDIAPGKYGNQHELTNATSDEYTVTVEGANPSLPLYVVAHAVVAVCK